MSSNTEPKIGVYEGVKNFVSNSLTPTVIEMMRLFPDGAVLGAVLLTVISGCKSYGFLLASMIEFMAIQRLFASVLHGISPVGAGPNVNATVCQNGFMYPNAMRISMLELVGKPTSLQSPSVFFATSVISYMISCIQEFKHEISTLGGDLTVRTTVAIVLSSLFIFSLFCFRIVYGCESFGTLLLSMIFGIVCGIIVMFQNKALFGREAINIMNLPILVSALERGKPMYVCSPT
jgi:hypothetical protein